MEEDTTLVIRGTEAVEVDMAENSELNQERAHWLLNDNMSRNDESCFLVTQFAISSYEGDPNRTALEQIYTRYKDSDDQKFKRECLERALAIVNTNSAFIQYAVWDYSLVAAIALREFQSWNDGIRDAYNDDQREEYEVETPTEGNAFFTLTVGIISSHTSLRNWLLFYPEHLDTAAYFERKTITTILNRLCTSDSKILPNCDNAIFGLMPRPIDRVYSESNLRTDPDWAYLRPVY